MRRLIYSSAEKLPPKKQAEINYLLQEQKVKQKQKEIAQLLKELEQEKSKAKELKKIYESY